MYLYIHVDELLKKIRIHMMNMILNGGSACNLDSEASRYVFELKPIPAD